MRVVDLPEILAAIDPDDIIAALKEGFRRLSAGEVVMTGAGHLMLEQADGDCHLKGAHLPGDDILAVKFISSFYRNPSIGLPASNGFSTVIDAKTGEVLAILHDRGKLTDLRTALTGAIAAEAIARPGAATLGIVGTGMQAELQAREISRWLGLSQPLVWGRDPEKAEALAARLGGGATSLTDLCTRADIIVTTTPSKEILLQPDIVPPGARIIAVGADSPGKRELDPRILARGKVIADSRSACADHGEASWAIQAGLIEERDLIELGELLSDPVSFGSDETVVVDLTGVGVQDLQIAKSVWSRLT